MNASKRLRYIEMELDITSHDEEETYVQAQEEYPFESVIELAQQAASEGDVLAIYLQGDIIFRRAQKLADNDLTKEALITQARSFLIDAALKGAGSAGYKLAGETQTPWSNCTVETLAFRGLMDGDKEITSFVDAFEEEPDFTTTKDIETRAREKRDEYQKILDANGIKEFIFSSYNIYDMSWDE